MSAQAYWTTNGTYYTTHEGIRFRCEPVLRSGQRDAYVAITAVPPDENPQVYIGKTDLPQGYSKEDIERVATEAIKEACHLRKLNAVTMKALLKRAKQPTLQVSTVSLATIIQQLETLQKKIPGQGYSIIELKSLKGPSIRVVYDPTIKGDAQ